VVLAVALDEPEAVRPWLEKANPTYPCLIDRNHHVADLYNLVNVPEAVWIDEQGRVVRPAESAGATDGFRKMNRTTFEVPAEVLAERTRVKSQYMEAVRDWARKGRESRFVLDESSLRARAALPDAAVAQAHALFKLGQALVRQGRQAEAAEHFEAAVKMHPDSWSIFRQSCEKDARGLASHPSFWARVDALGDRPYYRAAQLE
jgi:hypothetical protein